MKKTTMLAMAGLLMVGGAACNRKPQGGPDAAIERAYKAGILSQSEYEAKKAAQRAASTPSAPAAAPTPAPVAAVVAAASPAPATTAPAPAPAPTPSA